jgi:hypothetical protein
VSSGETFAAIGLLVLLGFAIFLAFVPPDALDMDYD